MTFGSDSSCFSSSFLSGCLCSNSRFAASGSIVGVSRKFCWNSVFLAHVEALHRTFQRCSELGWLTRCSGTSCFRCSERRFEAPFYAYDPCLRWCCGPLCLPRQLQVHRCLWSRFSEWFSVGLAAPHYFKFSLFFLQKLAGGAI